CKADRAAFFENVAQDIASRPAGELHVAVKRVMRPKRFRKASADPLPLLIDHTGAVCQSEAASRDAWRRHFSALEDGVTVSAAELGLFDGTDQVDIHHVPTIIDLEAAFRATSPDKACGPDMLPPALCHYFGADLAQLFWPMVLKTVFRSAEAALHRTMRSLAIDHWNRWALPMQIGGKRGCSAHFGHFASRAFMHVARSRACSAGVLFVDLAAAYYSVVRETITGDQLGERSISEIAATLHLSPEDLQLLSRHVAEDPVLCEQHAATLLTEVASEMHSHTWFVLAGDASLVRTHRGTRPGGALADVIFNILFGRVLQRRDSDELQGTGLSLPWDAVRNPFAIADASSPRITVQDVVFADDLASFVISPGAAGIRAALSN
ncbi:unnamed protein product, partial [Symbiodinium sp. CCMP2456]